MPAHVVFVAFRAMKIRAAELRKAVANFLETVSQIIQMTLETARHELDLLECGQAVNTIQRVFGFIFGLSDPRINHYG